MNTGASDSAGGVGCTLIQHGKEYFPWHELYTAFIQRRFAIDRV